MKKLLLGLLALILLPQFSYAQTTTLASSSPKGSEVISTSTPEIKSFTICSQEAIERRDTNIAASRQAYNVSMTNALTERKNREKAAVALEDEDKKKEAIKESVDAYKSQTKAAQNTLTQARKTLWQTFENDIKNCRENNSDAPAQAQASLKAASSQAPEDKAEKSMMMRKVADEPETKTIKETIKAQIETFLSIFNN